MNAVCSFRRTFISTSNESAHTCRVPEETQATASFVAKANGVVAGLYVASVVFKRVSPDINMTWMVNDGDTVVVGQTMGVANGPARALLVGERVALNYLQRMSGIATNAAEMVKAIGCCTRATVLDTRKTVPGLRLLDKWAVLIGGAENHRMGLYDMMMIKDNHIAAAGGILKAVDAAEVCVMLHMFLLIVFSSSVAVVSSTI